MVITIVSRLKHLWVVPDSGAPVDLVESPRLRAVLVALKERGGSARPMGLKPPNSPKAPHYRSLARLRDLGLVVSMETDGGGHSLGKGRPVEIVLTSDGEAAASALENRIATV